MVERCMNITTWCGSMLGLGMRLPRKALNKTKTLHACVLGDGLMCFMCDHVN